MQSVSGFVSKCADHVGYNMSTRLLPFLITSKPILIAVNCYIPLVQLSLINHVRHYATRNPLQRRTIKELIKGVSGGRGGRGGRGRRKGGAKGLKPPEELKVGRGAGGVRWPGLSYPLPQVKSMQLWDKEKLIIQTVDEKSEEWDNEDIGVVDLRKFEDSKMFKRRISEKNWSRKGWSGQSWGGRFVGCPESPDGQPRLDFHSIVIEMKRVANQTRGGKKRTISCLVIVGNGNGAAGFAVGKGDDARTAIRKAKNKAVNYLQVIPLCDNHTIYHNIKTKYCKTQILMERKVKGHGLRCQRAITAISELVGIKDMRAKIIGSTNPLNIVRATFRGLSLQETHQDLADRTGKFLVEFRHETNMRPVVVAIPQDKKNIAISLLKELQMLPHSHSSIS